MKTTLLAGATALVLSFPSIGYAQDSLGDSLGDSFPVGDSMPGWTGWDDYFERNRSGANAGFFYSGFVIGQATTGTFGTDFGLEGQVKLGFNFDLGGGNSAGAGAFLEAGASTFGTYTDVLPFVNVRTDSFRVMVGYGEDALDKIAPNQPVSPGWTSFKNIYTPLVRVDTKFGDVRVAASASIDREFSFAASRKFGNAKVFGGFYYDEPFSYFLAEIGGTYRFNDQTKATARLDFNGTATTVEGGVKFIYNDRLLFTADAIRSWDSFGGFTGATAGARVGLVQNVILFGDYTVQRPDGGPTFYQGTVGMKVSF